MSYRIGPMDTIPIGARVRVGNDFGYVVKAEVVQSSNNRGSGGMIVVHTIEFTEKRKNLYGSKYKMVPLTKSKVSKINYASIVVLE